MPRLAERVAGGDEDARPRESRGQLAAVDGGVGGPQEVGLAVGDLEAAAAQLGAHARALLRDPLHPLLDQLRAAGQRLQRTGLRDLGDAEVGLELGEQVGRAGSSDRVADAQAGQSPGLGEAPEDEQPRVILQQVERGVAGLGVGELHERLVKQHRDALRQPVEQSAQLARGQELAGGIVGAGQRDHAHARVCGGLEQRVHPARDAHRAAVGATGHDRIERVGGPGGQQLLTRLDHRAGGRGEQLRGAVTEDQAIGLDAVALGQAVAQLVSAQMGVAVKTAPGDVGDRVDDPAGAGARARSSGRGRASPRARALCVCARPPPRAGRR